MMGWKKVPTHGWCKKRYTRKGWTLCQGPTTEADVHPEQFVLIGPVGQSFRMVAFTTLSAISDARHIIHEQERWMETTMEYLASQPGQRNIPSCKN